MVEDQELGNKTGKAKIISQKIEDNIKNGNMDKVLEDIIPGAPEDTIKKIQGAINVDETGQVLINTAMLNIKEGSKQAEQISYIQ